MYLYTDEIEFAPFSSGENPRSRNVDPSPDDPIPLPSPKSIYRLADKVRSMSSRLVRLIAAES